MAVYDLSKAALKDIDCLYEYGILNFGLNQLLATPVYVKLEL